MSTKTLTKVAVDRRRGSPVRKWSKVWIAAGRTDMRRGMHGLSALVQTALAQSPFSGDVFGFRGRRGDLIQIFWFDGDGLCLFLEKLERGRFVWPQAENGAVSLTRAQFSVLLEDTDWCHGEPRPQRPGPNRPVPKSILWSLLLCLDGDGRWRFRHAGEYGPWVSLQGERIASAQPLSGSAPRPGPMATENEQPTCLSDWRCGHRAVAAGLTT
jgi:transposase